MKNEEISNLAKLLAEELVKHQQGILTTTRFRTFENRSGSDCLGYGDCPPDYLMCPTDTSLPIIKQDDIDIYANLSKLKPDELKKVFEAANIIKKLRTNK